MITGSIGHEKFEVSPSSAAVLNQKRIKSRVERHQELIADLAVAQRDAREQLANALRRRGQDRDDLDLLRAAVKKERSR